MNKKLLIIVIAIIVLTIGGIVFLMTSSDEGSETTSQTTIDTTESTGSPIEETPAASESAGQYIDYDESLLATTEGDKIIFFHAPWCPQCRALEADILDKGVPAGATIFKLDYDTNQDLRQKYGVTIQTTLVKVDENGNELEKFVAYDDPTVESVKANLLD